MAMISTLIKRTWPVPSVAGSAEQRAFDLGFYNGFGAGTAQGNRRLAELRREFGCVPLPPESLRRRAGGDPDRDKFLGTGQAIYGDLKRLAAIGGKPFSEARAICDFGCGCGRVTRFSRAGGGVIAGIDIDTEAIAWCRVNLSELGTFMAAPHAPPLALPDGAFDLIFAVSVFTHMAPPLGEAWLRELNRLLSADGVLIVTVLNEEVMGVILPEGVEMIRAEGVSYPAKPSADGLPGFHGLTFHSPAYVQDRWSQLLSVAGYFPKSIAGFQDAVVCRKRHGRDLNRGERPAASAAPPSHRVR